MRVTTKEKRFHVETACLFTKPKELEENALKKENVARNIFVLTTTTMFHGFHPNPHRRFLQSFL